MRHKPPCHILFLGGEKRHLPLERLHKAERLGLLSWEHKSGFKKSKLTFGAGGIPTVAFIFADHISHASESKLVSKLQTLRVPIVKASGGFPSLLEEAKKRGHEYIVKVFSNGMEEKPKKSDPETLKARPSGEAPFIRLVDIDGVTYRVTYKKGVLSLIVKGPLLDEVDEYARTHKLGNGKRGGILIKEAQELVEYLNLKYNFEKYGIRINPLGIQKNVNLIRGALTPKAAALATRKGKKTIAKERRVRREEISSETGAHLSLKDGKIKGSAVEIFLSEMAQTMQVLARFPDKYEKLFGRILDLEEMNRILGDENEGLKKDLDLMKADRAKWKKIATEEDKV